MLQMCNQLLKFTSLDCASRYFGMAKVIGPTGCFKVPRPVNIH